MVAFLPNLVGGAIAPVIQAVTGACMFLKDKYDEVKKIKENLDKLKGEKESILAKKSTLEDKIRRNRYDKEPTQMANTWLEQVERRVNEARELESKCEDIPTSLCGMCPFYKLMKLSEDLVEKTEELKVLKMDMDLQNALREKEFEPGEIMTPGDEGPMSISETVQVLQRWLGQSDVRTIGIWGMAGVGKTFILKHLKGKAYQEGKFNPIIPVKVQKADTVKNIQSDILAWLKLDVQSRDTTESVKRKISTALEKLDYLLLLDQCPGDIDLNAVGIRDDHKGKVVVAARDKPNCGIHRVHKVSKLSDGDAEELFQKTAGAFADHPHIIAIKEQILKQLGGLPLAIKAIAIRLRDQPESVWYDTLRELQYPKNFGDQYFVELFKAFEFSYHKLGDDFRKCLLYGALFPPDYEIDKDYLTECWISEQFISAIELAGAETNVQELSVSRDRGHRILQALTEATLFEWCSRPKFLTMPVPFRKIALTFTYPQEGGSSSSLLVRAQEKLTSPPEMEQWSGAKRISLMCNELSSLPEFPNCPTTTTLLLQINKELVTIHDLFFTSMTKLRILDLHQTKIQSLPPSIFELVDLNALYLNQCQNLVSLSEHLGRLTNLKILDIQDTGLQCLPTEVAQLVSLRCLRVSFVYNRSMERVNGDHNNEDNQPRSFHAVIGRLHRLEELSITVDPSDQSWNDIVTSVVEVITNLKSLTALFFYFPEVKFLTAFIDRSCSWKNQHGNSFRAFRLIVGSNVEDHDKELHGSRGPAERRLRFSADENVCCDCEAIKEVLRRSNAFELIGNQYTNSLSHIGIDCMEALAVCVVKDCDQMSSIISCGSEAAGTVPVFQFLEKLDLVNLKSLCCIIRGSVGPQSFSHLTTITVHKCHMLKKLISLGMVRNLMKLQHVKIEDCSGIDEVIETEETGPNGEAHNLTGFLPNLEILELVNLPSLASICKNASLDWRSLEKIVIIGCFELNTWSKGMCNAKHLRKIKCQKGWWGLLQLPDGVKQQLEERCSLIWEEAPSASYAPREDEIHQPPDLQNLPDRFDEILTHREDSIMRASSSGSYCP